MVLNVPEIPPKVRRIVTLSGGRRGGPRKTTLSLFKDDTIRLERAGVKGKSDDVILYDVFSHFEGVPLSNVYTVPFLSNIHCIPIPIDVEGAEDISFREFPIHIIPLLK